MLIRTIAERGDPGVAIRYLQRTAVRMAKAQSSGDGVTWRFIGYWPQWVRPPPKLAFWVWCGIDKPSG